MRDSDQSYLTADAVDVDIDIETCSECGGDVRIIPKALAPLAGQALACIA